MVSPSTAPTPACGTSTLAYTPQTGPGAGWSVPARAGAVDGTLAVTLSQAVSMGTTAASSCQGATFTVYLRAGS